MDLTVIEHADCGDEPAPWDAMSRELVPLEEQPDTVWSDSLACVGLDQPTPLDTAFDDMYYDAMLCAGYAMLGDDYHE